MEARTNAADIWRRHISAQQASGQSIRAWCRANACQEHSYYWWRARLKLQPARGRRRHRPDSINPIAFAEVVATGMAEPIRLRLGGQRELLLPATMALEQVAKLVHVIEALV